MRIALLILLLVVLGAMVIAQRRHGAKLRLPMALVALLALGLALTFALKPGSPGYVHRLEPHHRAVAYTLGKCVRDRDPEASRVLVIQDLREDPKLQRFLAQQRAGLAEGLGDGPCELVILNLRDLTGNSIAAPEEGVDRSAVKSAYDRFVDAAKANPEASSIVSFVSYPGPLRLFLRRSKRHHAYVWDLGIEEAVNWDAEFAAGRVAARVFPKRQGKMHQEPSQSDPMEEVFAMRYQLQTAQ